MALRLAGERALVIQGADHQGWIREITVQDALSGLKINQQGTGRVFDFQDGGVSKMYLPDGGNVNLVGSLVFDLANDVTVTPANPSAPRTLTIPDPGGNDSFVFLAAPQTLTGKTLTSPIVQGAVGAGSGLTMPAFTAGGNITGGAGFQLGTSAGDLVLNPAGHVLAASGKILYFTSVGTTRNARINTANTPYVSTATTILADLANKEGNLVFISGRNRANTNMRFGDLIIILATVITVLHSTGTGTPDARTYTLSGETLQLAMAANTYAVQATVIQHGTPD